LIDLKKKKQITRLRESPNCFRTIRKIWFWQRKNKIHERLFCAPILEFGWSACSSIWSE